MSDVSYWLSTRLLQLLVSAELSRCCSSLEGSVHVTCPAMISQHSKHPGSVQQMLTHFAPHFGTTGAASGVARGQLIWETTESLAT